MAVSTTEDIENLQKGINQVSQWETEDNMNGENFSTLLRKGGGNQVA